MNISALVGLSFYIVCKQNYADKDLYCKSALKPGTWNVIQISSHTGDTESNPLLHAQYHLRVHTQKPDLNLKKMIVAYLDFNEKV